MQTGFETIVIESACGGGEWTASVEEFSIDHDFVGVEMGIHNVDSLEKIRGDE
jgi:hypothetical protein